MTKISEDIIGGEDLPLFFILNIGLLLWGKIAYQSKSLI